MEKLTTGLDAYAPPEVAEHVESFGVAKDLALAYYATYLRLSRRATEPAPPAG
jgi:hypothetical protein